MDQSISGLNFIRINIKYIVMSINNLKNVIRGKVSNSFEKISADRNGIDVLEKAVVDHLVIPFTSFNDYVVGNKVPTKRWIKYWLKFVIYLLFSIKYAVLYWFKSSSTISLLGEYLYVIFKLDIVYLICLVVGVSGMAILLLNYYFTVSDRFEILVFLHRLKENKEFPYHLVEAHNRRFLFGSYVANVMIFKYIQSQTKVCILLVAVISIGMAYADTRIEHSLWRLVVSGALNYYASVEVIYVLWSGVMFTCLVALYLFYSFRQIRQQISHSIECNNKLLIRIAIRRHDRMSALTLAFNDYIRFIIGVLYVFPPITITLFMTLATDPTQSLWKRFFSVFCCLVCVVGTYMTTFMAAYITSENKRIVKELYPIVGKITNNLRLKLLIDSFVCKLNYQFIGFYCFNLFRFTKFSFFEYSFLLSSTYFLINKLKSSVFN